MTRAFSIILIALLLIPTSFKEISCGAENKEGNEINNIESLSNDLSLHYTGKYCKVCHNMTKKTGSEGFLKYGGDYKRLCKCHDNSLGNYNHPVGIVPSEGKRLKMPKNFPLRKGEVWCITCHQIKILCLEKKKENSLRGEPFKNRTEFCFKCHNEQNYMKHDIHKQINEKGEMIADKCLTCHTEKPDTDYERLGGIKLVENMEAVCQGCHLIAPTHVGKYDHTRKKPSPETLAKMKHAEETYGIILPLDEKGNMTCITCHNPHAKGVIPEDKPAAKGADSKFRHRAQKICFKCHEY